MTSASSGPSFFAAFRQIGGLTAISRVLGFGRDVILAVTIGAGPIADAFFVAFKLPNLFRRLTAEGAITNAFLPAYAKARKQSQAAADLLAAEIQLTLLWGLLALMLVMQIFMPVVISVLAPGFSVEDTRFDQAVTLARVTLPYLPMISMVAFWAAVTNANNHFIGGAAAPILLNIMLMIGAVISAVAVSFGAVPLALAVPIAGLLQMAMMQRILASIGKTPSWGFWPSISQAGKAMWRKFFAAALGAGGTQLNLLVDMVLASLMPVGAISALYYADRIAQLPLGVIGIALGTALLPRLSHLEAAGKDADIRLAIADGVRLGLFFGLPAMIGAILLAEDIIGGLFGYGAFDAKMITPTAQVLMAYAIGIPAFILAKVLQPSFYAADDPKTPLIITLIAVVVNLIGSLTLMQILGVVGLALATSLASWFIVIAYGVILWWRRRIDRHVGAGLWAMLAATLAMALVLMMASMAWQAWVMPVQMTLTGVVSVAATLIRLFVLIGFGGATYFVMAYALGAMPTEMIASFRRRKSTVKQGKA